MIVKCPCGFWAHGADDMCVVEVYEKHLVGCHQEGLVPEPEVESLALEMETAAQRLQKLQSEVLALVEHVHNMSHIIGTGSSLNSRADGWYRLTEHTEDRLRAMLARSTECQ